jgi:hypothetical protein
MWRELLRKNKQKLDVKKKSDACMLNEKTKKYISALILVFVKLKIH